MGTNIGQVMTLANSIIGVSVLAMPYCFKQCGVLLSVLLLFLSSVLSRLACRFLLKAAIITRRRNYEFLAFHVFGSSGKLCVELAIIGFLLGTCIAFFVVLGDLGPAISTSMFGLNHSDTLRSTILIGVAFVVVLPLGLLRNVDSLSSLCTATIAFYLCLVLKVMGEAAIPLMMGDWMSQLSFWRPEGVLQCLPIFSMALFCQTQLFEIFDSVPNAALDKMDSVVRLSVNMCTAVYISVGFFGYVAFSKDNITGNILMSLSESMSSEVIKLGFFLSVAASFPLVIFPCRASLYSLLYRNAQPPVHDIGATHVPEGRFKFLTLGIVGLSLTVGIFLPNIEQVLGIIGSTIGVTICIIIPALLLMNTARHPKDKLSAQIILWTGAVIMILGTYAHILNSEQPPTTEPDISHGANRFVDHAVDRMNEPPLMEHIAKFEGQFLNVPGEAIIKDVKNDLVNLKAPSASPIVPETAIHKHEEKENPPPRKTDDKRHEPPVPMETAEKLSDSSRTLGSKIESDKKEVKEVSSLNDKSGQKRKEPPVPVEGWDKQKEKPPLQAEKNIEVKAAQVSGAVSEREQNQKVPFGNGKDNKMVSVEPMDSVGAAPESKKAELDAVKGQKKKKIKSSELLKNNNEPLIGLNAGGGEQVNQDAIRHEDAELALEGKKVEAVGDGKVNDQDKEASDINKKSQEQDLLKTLKEHQEVQRDMLNEQHKILQELKKHELGHQTSVEKIIKEPKMETLNLHSMKRLNNIPSNVHQSTSDVIKNKKNRILNVLNDSKTQEQLQVAIYNQQDKSVEVKENVVPGNLLPAEQQMFAQANKGQDKPKERLSGAANTLDHKPVIMPLPLAYKVSSQPPPRQPAGRDILESQIHLEREKREINVTGEFAHEQGNNSDGPLKEEHQHQHVPGALDKDKEKECSLKPISSIHNDEMNVSNNLENIPVSKDLPSVASSSLKSSFVDSDIDKKSSSLLRTIKHDPADHAPPLVGNMNQAAKSSKLDPAMELKTPSSISEPRVEISRNLEQHIDIISLASGAPTKNTGPKHREESR